MIAAQLLAYYFTELKDDQIKKVSLASSAAPRWPRRCIPASARAAAASSILYPPASGLPQASIGWTAERLGKASPLLDSFWDCLWVCMCVFGGLGVGKTPETGLLAAVSLKSAADVRWAPGYAGRWLCGDRWA